MDIQHLSPMSEQIAEFPDSNVYCIDLTLESEGLEENDSDIIIISTFSKPVVLENEDWSDAASSLESSGLLEDELDSDLSTISDDEDLNTETLDPTRMICRRCPLEKQTVWKHKKRFLMHIKRHQVAGQFSCVHCKKPFVKICHCIKHERIMHRTEGWEDLEDVFAHNAQKSSAICKYRGPPVSSVYDSYEIQLYSELSKKASKTNALAKIAVKNRKKNIKLKRVVSNFGRLTETGDLRQNANKPVKRNTRNGVLKLQTVATGNPAELEANGA